MSRALIVEGGAMRGIFSSGILDTFIAADYYPFDQYLGVSAGASNLVAYLGKQQGRNYRVYTDYCRRPQCISWPRFLRGGSLIDIEWLWDITERELPIGEQNIALRREQLLITTTCATSGDAHYLTPEMDEIFQMLKASGTMPVAFRGEVKLRGRQWFDGGVSDSVPVEEAYRRGARDILILRSNPVNYRKKAYRISRLFPKIMPRYPKIAERLQQRHEDYNRSIEFIRNPPADCRIHEICPPDKFPVGQFTRDLNKLNSAYEMGLAAGRTWLNNSDF